jgi:tetratricopeptide (TPR) repeat protein
LLPKYLIFLLLLLCPIMGLAQSWAELNNAGMLQYKQGEYREAENLFTLAIKSAATGEEHVTSLSSLGYCQQALGDYPAAQQSFRQCVRLANRFYPPLHIERIEVLTNLANAFLPSGQYDSCEYYMLKAEELLTENVYGKNNHYLENIFSFYNASITIQSTIASLASKKGQFTKAGQIMEQLRLDIRAIYPDEYRSLPAYIRTLNNLTTYYISAEAYQRAKLVAHEQLDLLAQEKNSLPYLDALNNLGSIYRNLEQYDSAILIYTTALLVLDTGAYHGTDLHIAVLTNMGDLLFSQEDYPNAIAALQKSISLQENRAGQNPRVYQMKFFITILI